MNFTDFPEIQPHPDQGLVFGVQGQIKILGHVGKANKNSGNKLFVVHCSVCSQDQELFGDGIFPALKSNMTKGVYPCGCAKFKIWTEAQQKVRISRKAESLGYTFVGWKSDFVGSKTYCIFNCEKHGKWDSTDLNAMMVQNHACSKCAAERISKANRKSDSEMIESFLHNNSFPEGTTFERVEGKKRTWLVSCPECNTKWQGHSTNLQKGTIGCECGPSNRKYSYINLLKDGEVPIAVKFGITAFPSIRVNQQNRKSVYDVESLGVWEFESYQLCKKAENSCSKDVITGVISKEEMRDGYTETTFTSNISKLISIFEEFGGVRVP